MVKVILIMGGIVNEYRYRGLSMLKSKILRYSRKTGKDPEPGEPKYPETVYRVTVYGHTTPPHLKNDIKIKINKNEKKIIFSCP